MSYWERFKNLIGMSQGNGCTIESANLRAMLMTIRYAEGTQGEDGYRKMYGGSYFTDFSKHPRKSNTRWGKTSTAAGAYQILAGTWDELKVLLKLPDFSPNSQDIAAVQLIARRNALALVEKGNFEAAIERLRKEWASLPGASQSRTAMAEIKSIYESNGGSYA